MIDFNPNGLYLASTSFDKSVIIWDLRKGSRLYTLTGHKGATSAVSFSKNGEYFATGAQDSLVILWKSNCLTTKESYKSVYNRFPRQFIKNDVLNNPVKIDINIKSKDNLGEDLSKLFERMVSQMEVLTKTLYGFDSRLNKIEEIIDQANEDNDNKHNDLKNNLVGLKNDYNVMMKDFKK